MTRENLPCLLLPVQEKNLVLPMAAVAEIIAYEEPIALPDVPNWFLGLLTWRGIQIPLTRLEKMDSYLAWDSTVAQKSDTQNKAQIAIINRITKSENTGYPFFAIVLKNTPKLFRLSQTMIETESQPQAADFRFVLTVKVGEEISFVPNLESLWKVIDTLPLRLQRSLK
jgi:chemosensory pili system protein ChpC